MGLGFDITICLEGERFVFCVRFCGVVPACRAVGKGSGGAGTGFDCFIRKGLLVGVVVGHSPRAAEFCAPLGTCSDGSDGLVG